MQNLSHQTQMMGLIYSTAIDILDVSHQVKSTQSKRAALSHGPFIETDTLSGIGVTLNLAVSVTPELAPSRALVTGESYDRSNRPSANT